jgi:hypothetical protein
MSSRRSSHDLWGMGVVRDSDFNIMKKDYMIGFKLYTSSATYSTTTNYPVCFYKSYYGESVKFTLQEEAYYQPLMFLEESYKPYIYLRKYDDDDAAGGSQGVGLDSNLLGKGVIVEYKHTSSSLTNFFYYSLTCQDGYYLDDS